MDNKKNISSLKLETRISEIGNMNTMVDLFGNTAYTAIEKYNLASGYETGFDLLMEQIKEATFSPDKFKEDPIKGVADFLFAFFKNRGGNLPRVWVEQETVYLMTELDKHCITIEAEKSVKPHHRDICNIYCRAFATGLIKIFEDFFPGLKIFFHNKSSKRKGEDCIEAFHVVVP